jgi:hypothetical protein
MSDMNFSAMKVAQLRQIAAESGIDIPQKAKKKDIIDLIEKKIEEVKAQIESGELQVMEPKVIVQEEEKTEETENSSEESSSDDTDKTDSKKEKSKDKKYSSYQPNKKAHHIRIIIKKIIQKEKNVMKIRHL